MSIKYGLKLLFLLLPLLGSIAVFAQTQAQPCAPGISYWSLLGNVKIGYFDGRLNIDKLYGVCLPAPTKQSGSNYPYDPDAGGRLSMTIRGADGKEINTFVWYAESIGGLWELSRYKVVGGYEAMRPLRTGQYLLEFAIEGKPFYRFPFSVAEVKSDDPYQPSGTRYFLEGAWNDYGNLFYQRNDPQSSLRFTTWVQEKAGRDGKRSVPYEVKLTCVKDGKVLARDAATLRLEPRWLQLDLSLRPTEGEQNAYFKAGELLREDGQYRVSLAIDGKPYGNYLFVVKGGRIQFQGRQVREATDPSLLIVDYISGGRYSSWWVKREGSAK